MSDKPIIVNKDDLREIVSDFTSNDRAMQSKFWGSVQDALRQHTQLLDEHTATITAIHTDIALMKQSQARQEESQSKILAQTSKTNGRVTKLEMISLAMKWGSIVVWVAVIPLCIWIFFSETGYIAKQLTEHINDTKNFIQVK